MKLNTRSKYIFCSLLLSIVALAMIQGCNLRSWVKVNAPRDVLIAVDLPEGSLTLDQADAVFEEWSTFVTSNTKQFQVAMDDANARYELLNQWVSVGLSLAQTGTNGIPYGGLIFAALTGAAGVMVPQPKFVKSKKE
jgi:hypothetical protein